MAMGKAKLDLPQPDQPQARQSFPPVRLVVSDLDRTLLRDDKTISDYTESVLRRCKESGILLAIATARPRNRIGILPFLHLTDAWIVNNGAAVYLDGMLIECAAIGPDQAIPFVRQVITMLPETGLSVEFGDLAYTNMDIRKIWASEFYYGLNNLPEEPVDKIVIHSGPTALERVEACLPEGLYAQNCEDRLILIMNRQASKWNAVRMLAERLDIPVQSIIAFGDDHNDREMLLRCGVGVAVANAIEETRQAADFTCGSNQDDGVARWLEAHVLAPLKSVGNRLPRCRQPGSAAPDQTSGSAGI